MEKEERKAEKTGRLEERYHCAEFTVPNSQGFMCFTSFWCCRGCFLNLNFLLYLGKICSSFQSQNYTHKKRERERERGIFR